MTFLATPLALTAVEFSAYVEKLHWANWRPQFLVLHNTAEPNLAQWIHSGLGKTAGAQRVKNLNHYYKTEEGWHSGPQIFVAPDFIWVACDLEADGVHASCYNRVSIGVEMVGDFATEPFDSGDGAKVRDNAVACLAALHKVLHWQAYRDPEDLTGWGATEAAAIADLKQQEWEDDMREAVILDSIERNE